MNVFVRTIDRSGRTAVPLEIRRMLNLRDGDTIEYCMDGDKAVVRKFCEMDSLSRLIYDFERDLRAMEPIVTPGKVDKLLADVREMRRILAEK